MKWAVMLYQKGDLYYSVVLSDNMMYKLMQQVIEHLGMFYLGGKGGIPDDEIDSVRKRVDELKERLKKGEALDLNLELMIALDTRNSDFLA